MTTRSCAFKRVLSFIMAFAMILTLLPTAVFAADTPTTLYLKPNSNWLIDNARFAAYFFGNGDTWVSMTDEDGDGYYEVTAPEGYPNVIFCRMNPGTTENNWNNKWNQSSDLTVPTDLNTCYTVADGAWDNGSGTWSHEVHSYTATVTAPDCTNGGYTTYTCACGESYTGEKTDAAGHQYENGICTVCGEEDPDYIPPVVETVLYLKPNSNWTQASARFAAYFFGNGETWISMTDEDGDGYYEVTAPEAYPNVIFCRMNPGTTENNWDNKWNQSSDLTVPTDDNNCYTVAEGAWDKGDGAWSVYTPAGSGDTDPSEPDPTPSEPEEPDTITVYFRNDWLWPEVYVHYWNDAQATEWPGVKMTFVEPLAEGDVYSAEIPTWATGLLFNGLENGNNSNRQQTPDVTDFTDGSAYYIHWDGKNKCSPFEYTPGGSDDGDEPAPTPSEYYLAGYINNADYEGTDYKFENETLTVTFSNDSYVYITTDVGTAYKAQSYISDVTGTFFNSTTGANEKMFVPGGVEVTFTLVVNDDDTLTLSYSVPVIEDPVTEFTIHFRNTGLWDEVYYHAWLKTSSGDQGITNWPGEKITEDSECTNWYTVTLSSLNGENGVGILFNNNGKGPQTGDIVIPKNGEYWYDGALLTEAPATWPDGTVKNVKYEAAFHFANSLKWSSVNLYTWTADGYQATGNWPGQTCNMVDGFYTLTATYEAPEGQGLNFIFNNGSLQTADLALDASAFTLDAETGVYKAEKWVALTTTDSEGKYNADIVDHPDAIAFSPVVDGTSVTFQYRDADAAKVEVFGTMNNWDAGYTMTRNDHGVWSVTVENLTHGIHEYKFVVDDNWITDPLNSWTQNDNSAFLISNPELDTNSVTVRVHFENPDDSWNVYAWGTGLADQFDFDENHIATILLNGRAHQYVCFKVRQSVGTNDWYAQSHEVRVDLSTIVSGTIDVYVTNSGDSWSSSQKLNNDVVTANKISSVELDYDNGTVVITTSEPVDDPETAFSVKGSSITNVSVSGSTYTLTLDEALDLVTLYQHPVNFTEQAKFTDHEYVIGTAGVYASDRFAAEFTYEGDDLGATYIPATASDPTTVFFRVWAPTAEAVTINIYASGTAGTDDFISSAPMRKDINGTWFAELIGSLEGRYYTYSVTRNGETVEACDPYARATGVNGQRAMIIDLDSTDPENWDSDSNPNPITSYTDAIIYELHVRDFSIDDSSGVSEANRGKYLAFTEEGTTTANGVSTGIDYLDELGITHLHLLPVYDYGSVDETTSEDFNWGYDPVNYNVPEGSYSTNPYDGAVRVSEMKQMVQSLHEHDISVVMDVVYNHVYDSGEFCFNQIVPGYFSRVNSNASGCGNDTASEREMVRKYIVESVLYWTEEYHIDGFRFDLVGLLDVETINQIVTEVHKIRPDVIFYGEGWDMDSTNKESGTEMAKQHNADKTPGFAYFSDSMRNLIAGDNGNSRGFVSGLTGQEEQLANNFMAKPTSWGSAWTDNPQQVVQYVSCHDNYTLIDKLIISTGKSTIDEEIIKMNNLSAAIYMTAQGIPFIHAGEELLREKINSDGSRNHNSYNASDDVNHIEWSNLENEIYADTSDYYKGLIEFRKAHAGLRLDSAAEIADSVEYTWITNEVVMFTIDAEEDISDSIIVIFNATDKAQEVTLPEGEWNICINSTTAGTESLGTVTSTASVAGISALVLVQGETCAHDWMNATCTEPKTCTLCGATEGEAAGHTPAEPVKENVTPATCTSEGAYDEIIRCDVCGETISKESKTEEKLPHEYEDGKCKNCGEVDPDYVAPTSVIRIFGDHRWQTAIEVADEMKAQLGVEKFNAIIVASGNDFADALAGSYLSTVKNAPILLSWGNGGNYAYLDTNNVDYIKANLAAGGTVYILGGEAAVPASYETALSGYNVKRLGGANRFETNLLILAEAGVKAGDEILVCTSTNFADSLSASATGKPILLVWNEHGKLYGGQPDYLASLEGNTFCIVGGENAVCAELETEISAYGKTERLAGANRFETSVKVAQRYFADAEAAVLAYAWNYPDGLCGGALAYAMKAPLILTMNGYESAAAAYAKAENIKTGIVLGGTGLISDETVRTIFSMESDDTITVR